MITAAFTNQGKLDFLKGRHQPGHTYKLALYSAATASLDKTTTVYTTTGELPTADGYTQGGQVLTNVVFNLSGDVAYIDADDPLWDPATLAAEGALIYNDTLADKPAIAVLSFGGTITSTNGPFAVQLPPPGATAIARIA